MTPDISVSPRCCDPGRGQGIALLPPPPNLDQNHDHSAIFRSQERRGRATSFGSNNISAIQQCQLKSRTNAAGDSWTKRRAGPRDGNGEWDEMRGGGGGQIPTPRPDSLYPGPKPKVSREQTELGGKLQIKHLLSIPIALCRSSLSPLLPSPLHPWATEMSKTGCYLPIEHLLDPESSCAPPPAPRHFSRPLWFARTSAQDHLVGQLGFDGKQALEPSRCCTVGLHGQIHLPVPNECRSQARDILSHSRAVR